MNRTVSLKDVSQRVDYGLTTSAVLGGDGPKFLRITDIDGSFIEWNAVPRCEASEKDMTKYSLADGDIVVARTGASTGRSQWVKVTEPSVFASYLVRFRVRPDIDSRFVGYVLNSVPWFDHVSSVAHGKSAQPNMSASEMARFEFDCPPLADQKAIAEVLGALDDKIAANTNLAASAISLLEARFSALGLNRDPVNDEAVVGLDEFVDLNPKLAAPSQSEPVYVDMQKLPVSGMSISHWDHRPAKGGARFMNGDTLLARITPCLENRKTGFVDFLEEGQIGIGSTEFIVLRSRPGVPIALSYFLATSSRFRTFAIRHMVGTSGRQRVSALDLTGYTVCKPVESALTQFGDASRSTFQLVKSLTEENRTLTSARDALLPPLMSGELRVRDAEKVLEDAGV